MCQAVPESCYSTSAAQGVLNSYCNINTCSGDGIGTINVNIQGDLVQLPYHINPDYASPESLFPWEAPADVLYAEHRALHPGQPYYDNYPEWRAWFKMTWRPEAIGILQTMINRANSDLFHVDTPTEAALAAPGSSYSAPYREITDEIWQDTYALSFEVIMMGTRVDQPYPYYAHQDLNKVRGFVEKNRNAICCNERTGFGPTSGWKDHYVLPYLLSPGYAAETMFAFP